MLPKPSLNRPALAAVQELRAEHGIEPTLDEILWLHELGKRVLDPTGDGTLNTGNPARAGNVYLWPLTISAGNWFNERALAWFQMSPEICHYCLAFAMAHGRGYPIPSPAPRSWFVRWLRSALGIEDPVRTLDELVDRDDAYRAVMLWTSRLRCRQEELDAAIDAVLDPPGDESSGSPIDCEQIADELAAITGTDVQHWRRGTSRNAAIHAYARAIALEAARRGQPMPPVKDALAVAQQDMRKAVVAIIKDHQQPSETTR